LREAPNIRSRAGREGLQRGHHPGYHLLNGCDLPGMNRPLQVVDFRTVFSLPLAYTQELAVAAGPRIRLRPPYREHLAQAFARFYMRVGLPVDLPLPPAP
jgi:hypothetical protein